MVEKRPFPGGHDDGNGVKRPKPSAPSAALDAIAAAKAKAAEIMARRQNGVPASHIPPPASAQPTAPASGGSDRLAAMKARIAALKGGTGASTGSIEAPPVQAPPSTTSRDEGRSRQSESSAPRVSATSGNRPVDLSKAAKPAPAPKAEEAKENPYFDSKAVPTKGRTSRGLLFNQRGKYLDQASKLRAQDRLEKIKKMLALQARRAGLDENSERGFLVQEPPQVEWWDEGVLGDQTYDSIDDPSKLKIDTDDSIITMYIQHPVLLKPPQEQRLVEVKPMHLTAKEQAKLRRMRRAEEHKEQQAKIRLGLEPPPPPKVKRGNMMRVMGEQAIADPTAVEMLVESQIAERHDTHIKANEERKLTKEERHAKLTDNKQKDAQKALYMCVFKVNSLAFGKHRYQIDNNAKQHALTGITLFNPKLNLVIVEGGSHSIEKYKKLMLHRIKWTENAAPTETQEEKQAGDPEWMKSMTDKGELKDLSANKCTLVFEGEVRQRQFRKWGSRMCESEGEAKEILGRNKLDSLWALAKSSE